MNINNKRAGAEALITLLLLKTIEPDTYADMSRRKAYCRRGTGCITSVGVEVRD